MSQGWKVIWYKDGKKFKKPFQGDKPRESGAIDYARSLIAKGVPKDDVHLVSMVTAFAPLKSTPTAPQPGMVWCPYCLKWRFFVEKALLIGGFRTPLLWRCPICSISIKDVWVRKFNVLMALTLDPSLRERTVSTKRIKRVVRSRK